MKKVKPSQTIVYDVVTALEVMRDSSFLNSHITKNVGDGSISIDEIIKNFNDSNSPDCTNQLNFIESAYVSFILESASLKKVYLERYETNIKECELAD